MDLVGIKLDTEAVAKAHEGVASGNRVALGDEGGILPDVNSLTCSTVDKALSDAEKIAMTWRPDPEGQRAFEEWMSLAKAKQSDCKALVTPQPKKRISKNLAPVVLILGAVVAGILVSKIFNSDKQA